MEWRWRSGGVLAAATAAGAITAQLSLRATSDGPMSVAASVIGAALLTLVLWPFAARASRVGPTAALLAAAQFGSHALGVLSAGQARSATALVCCPSAGQVRPGPIGELTAHAGWALAAVQLLACLALAIGLRAGRQGADLVAQALHLVRELLGSARARIRLAVRLLRALVTPTAPIRALRPRPCGEVIRPQREANGPLTRRGPPRGIRPVVLAVG